MCRKKTTNVQIAQILSLHKELSYSEISEMMNVSTSTIKRIVKINRGERTREESEAIRSRSRKKLIRAERRRAIFGLDQKTYIKVFSNKERNVLKYCLKRRRYIFLHRGENIAYYDEQTNRHPLYEERGRKLGIKFKQMESISII